MLGFCDGCGGKERLVSAFECRNYCHVCQPVFGIDALLCGMIQKLLETELPHETVRNALTNAQKAFDRGDSYYGGIYLRRAFVESALSESCGIGAAILVIAKMAESVKGLR